MAKTRSKILFGSNNIGLGFVLLIATMSSAVPSAFAYAPGDVNPLGKYGSGDPGGSAGMYGKWSPAWSEAFLKCAEQPEITPAINAIADGKMTDVGPGKEVCKTSDVFKPPNVKLLLLTFIKEMGIPESGYRSDRMNTNSPNPPAVGILQIGPSDVEAFQCKGPDGQPLYNGKPYVRGKVDDSRVAALKKPENNICCGLHIIASKIRTGMKKGKKMALASKGSDVIPSFWEVAKSKSSAKGGHGEQIKSNINQACEIGDFNKPGRYFSVAEIEAARKGPTGAGTVIEAGSATVQ